MRIAFFCIPAHGHTNPTLPVVAELVRRGHEVSYYSFQMMSEKIEATGARFVPCDEFTDDEPVRRLRIGSEGTTDMTCKALDTALAIDGMVAQEFVSARPDVVVSDSVCFWGKLAAQRHGIPYVCSTTTFAFNEHSSQYLQQSPLELVDLVLGMGPINRRLKALRKRGHQLGGIIDVVQNTPETRTIVYTSRSFQPAGDTFPTDSYRFVGPCVRPVEPATKGENPLVYVSLGTVVNDRPDFFKACIEAVSHLGARAVVSTGDKFDHARLGRVPEEVELHTSVDQLEVLSRASAFVTHCGMNSASEALYLGVPTVLCPQTGEQRAVARRVEEKGAGIRPASESAADIEAALRRALEDASVREAAEAAMLDLRSCGGAPEAADFIETAAS